MRAGDERTVLNVLLTAAAVLHACMKRACAYAC